MLYFMVERYNISEKRNFKIMRKIIVLTFVSLDGVMQGPGGPEEDTSGNFTLGGWTVPYFDEFLGNIMAGQMSQPFDLLLGRKTFEIFASYWPHHPEEEPVSRPRSRLLIALSALVLLASTVPIASAASSPVGGKAKAVFFASDGLRQDKVVRYADQGVMPTMKRLLRDGARASSNGLLTEAPPNTGAGWYTLATGAWPGVHVKHLDIIDVENPADTLRRYRKQGLVRGTQVGKCVRYRRSELEAFLARITENNPR